MRSHSVVKKLNDEKSKIAVKGQKVISGSERFGGFKVVRGHQPRSFEVHYPFNRIFVRFRDNFSLRFSNFFLKTKP